MHMTRFRAWLMRLGGLFSAGRREREIADELESHLQMHVEDNLRAGMTPDAARRHALLRLGGVESTREAYRDRGSLPLVEHTWQDIRFSWRQLRRTPGFTVTAVFILALGLCASVTVFALVDAALIRPLPYTEPSRLVSLSETTPLGPNFHLSYLDYLDWKRSNRVFSALEVFSTRALTLQTTAGPRQVDGAEVSAGLFRTLGVTPVLGRDFREGEDQPSAPRAVMLSHGIWLSTYGGDPAVLGQSVIIDSLPHTIVGVLPRSFHFVPAGGAELFTALHARCADERGCHDLSGLARLKTGVSVDQAQAELSGIARQLAIQYPDTNQDRGAGVRLLTDTVLGSVRPLLLLLLAGAGLLLLIAGVNVASLLLVRSESRKREFALRGALGASRARLIRQFIAEGLVLAGAAAMLGTAGAQIALRLLASVIPPTMMTSMPYLRDLALTPRAGAVAAALALVMASLFCLIPVLRLPIATMRGALADGSRGAAGTLWRRLGAHLVVVELATAMVLLVSAGLLGQSFYRLMEVDTGVQPDRVAALRVGVPRATYPKAEDIVAMQRRIIARLGTLPGVQAASTATMLPVGTGVGTVVIDIDGQPTATDQNQVTAREVGAGYFAAVRARLVAGRDFTEAEDTTRPRVVILNRTAARQFFPKVDPIGHRVQYQRTPESAMEIVGVVDDIKEGPLNQATRPAIYVPMYQDPGSRFFIVARTADAPEALLPTLRAAIREISPELVTSNETVLRDRIQDSPGAYLQRSSAWLVGGFAAVALLLGVVGLYGVIAYSVSQRTREIGVRMALGAQPMTVYRLILSEAGWLTLLGIAIGLAGSIAAAPLLGTLLFGIQSFDARTLIAVAGVLATAAVAASFIPARRAAGVNPVEALRGK